MTVRRAGAFYIALIISGVLLGAYALRPQSVAIRWSPEETAALRSLWIGSLPPVPADPSNAVADDPRAVALGHRLFFDTRLSADGKVACATCHQPERLFTDGQRLSHGLGVTTRNAMTVAGTAYNHWFFWDGRKDSQWAQALGPMENSVEHGGTRMQYARIVAEHYRTDYESLFGPLVAFSDASRFPAHAGPNGSAVERRAWLTMTPADRQAVSRVFANIGKAIAAYERRIIPGPARFDKYVAALLQDNERATREILTPDEIAGLRLFLGPARCTQCHNGPLFTNGEFHSTGVAVSDQAQDLGRSSGLAQVLADEFNCLSVYSDARKNECAILQFAGSDWQGLLGAFKTPTLRNLAATAPYMRSGEFTTLHAVLAHYNQGSNAPSSRTELKPLDLAESELGQLAAFLGSLNGPLTMPAQLLPPLPEQK